MRRAKWRTTNQTAGGNRLIRRRVDHGHHERLFGIQLGQDTGKSPRQHRFAGARWANEQQMMSTCCGNFKCPTCCWLSANIGHVNCIARFITHVISVVHPRQNFRPCGVSLQTTHEFAECGYGMRCAASNGAGFMHTLWRHHHLSIGKRTHQRNYSRH